MADAALRVTAVRSKRDLRRFVDLPYRLYDRERYPNWVPPLRVTVYDGLNERSPFYKEAARECFLAWRGDRVVGRVAAIENRAAMRFHDNRVGFWGYFECEDDPGAARALFQAAAAWLGARGLESMVGPVSPSTNYECGLLVDGFENRPTFLTAWNPPYYDALCTQAGLVKAKDLLGLWFPIAEPGYRMPEFVDRICERALKSSRVEFRALDPRHFASELRLCWDIYNDSWEKNWGFVPMPYDEFAHMAKDMRFLVLKGISFIATIDGKPAAFMLAVPDYNEALYHNRSGNTIPFGVLRMLRFKKRARVARVMALGVKQAYRQRGILAVLTREILRRGVEVGGVGAEASWLLEDNTLIVQPLRAMGARDRMRWRLYEGPTSPHAVSAT